MRVRESDGLARQSLSRGKLSIYLLFLSILEEKLDWGSGLSNQLQSEGHHYSGQHEMMGAESTSVNMSLGALYLHEVCFMFTIQIYQFIFAFGSVGYGFIYLR